jgi:hypothetical protein
LRRTVTQAEVSKFRFRIALPSLRAKSRAQAARLATVEQGKINGQLRANSEAVQRVAG